MELIESYTGVTNTHLMVLISEAYYYAIVSDLFKDPEQESEFLKRYKKSYFDRDSNLEYIYNQVKSHILGSRYDYSKLDNLSELIAEKVEEVLKNE